MTFMEQRRLNNLQLTLLVIVEVVSVQAMKKYGGMKVYLHAFLISTENSFTPATRTVVIQ